MYVALREEIKEGGKYYFNCAERLPHEHARDEETAKKLWVLSEKAVGLSGDQA